MFTSRRSWFLSIVQQFKWQLRGNFFLVCFTRPNYFGVYIGNTTVVWTCMMFVRKSVFDRINNDANISLEDRKQMMAEFDRFLPDHSLKNSIDTFILKWTKYRDFIRYFERKWVVEHPNWRNGITNNGPEYVYRTMNESNTVEKLECCVKKWLISSSFFF